MNESYCGLTAEDRLILDGRTMPPLWERDRSDVLRDRMGHAMGLVRVLCCEECGGENVLCDGHAQWNAGKERFELAEVPDTYQSIYCRDCGLDELHGKWVWRERSGVLWGCEECGCTDIEHQSWVDANTGEVTDDCGSRDVWCPQCECSEARCEEVERLKPYTAAAVLRDAEKRLM